MRACLNQREDSHMWKHMENVHHGEKTPDFSFKVIRTFQSALMRQVSEAVRVEKRGKVLNSKGIYNRCSLPRLTVQQNDRVVEPDRDEEGETGYRFPSSRETGVKRRGEESGRREEQPVRKRKRWCGQYGEGEVWGEKGQEGNIATFLYSAGEKVENGKVGGSMKQTKLKLMQESEVVARAMVKEILDGINNLMSLVMEEDEDYWLVEELDRHEEKMRKKLELEKVETETAVRGQKRKFLVKIKPPAPAKKRKIEKKNNEKIAPKENPIKHLWEKLKEKNGKSKTCGETRQPKKQCIPDSVSDSHAIGVEFDEFFNVPGYAVGVECDISSNSEQNFNLGVTKYQISDNGNTLIVLNANEGDHLDLKSNSN